MPLLDHFHPPLSAERRWESLHSNWATKIADALTERWLPPNYIAEEHAHLGPSVQIDVATSAREASATSFPVVFPAPFEVLILSTDTGPQLVAAIELVSPSNKDRPTERRAFATKVASYLYQGISVIIVDIVTNRRANLHNEVLRVMEAADVLQLPPETSLYAVAYRSLRRSQGDEVDVWRSPLALGGDLPTLPLGLRADLVIPVDFGGDLRRRLPSQAAYWLLNAGPGPR
jgi:Protein of unknown function (DUF4058)